MYRRYAVIAWTNFNFICDGVQYLGSDRARDSITKGYAGCCTGGCCPALGYIMPHDFQCIVCTKKLQMIAYMITICLEYIWKRFS